MEPIGMVKTWGEVYGLTEGEMRFYLYEVSLVMTAAAFILAPVATVVSGIGKMVHVDAIQCYKYLFITTVMNIDLQS